jgi:hypothetical protein
MDISILASNPINLKVKFKSMMDKIAKNSILITYLMKKARKVISTTNVI